MSEKRIADLEQEVSELRGQLDRLSLSFTQLRREFRASGRHSESDREDRRSEDSFSLVSHDSRRERSSSAYPSTEPERPRAKASPSPPLSSTSQPAGLSWGRREEIADQIGAFFRSVPRGQASRQFRP